MKENLRLKFTDPSTGSYKIKIVGVGGAGGNIVETIMRRKIEKADFIVINTDKQVLNKCGQTFDYRLTKIQIGAKLTGGFGAGGKPYIGTKAIEENYEDVKQALKNIDVLFVTCGMGGGTGTGASPIIAKIAKELGSFVVGVVTFPFNFELIVRANQAKEGIHKLKKYTDALIVVQNQKLFSLIDGKVPLSTAFEMANQALFQIIRGITEIINSSGPVLVNVDFADVCAVMAEPGETFIGIGAAKGEGRAIRASRQAINSKWMEEKAVRYATDILVNFTGDSRLNLLEVEEAMKVIRENIPENSNVIFGACIDENLKDEIRITLIATGINRWRPPPDIIEKEENLKIPTFKRKTNLYTESKNFKENEKLDIPTFIRRQNELDS